MDSISLIFEDVYEALITVGIETFLQFEVFNTLTRFSSCFKQRDLPLLRNLATLPPLSKTLSKSLAFNELTPNLYATGGQSSGL